jgi:ABC-type lipoprotein release transport system permease subunit
VDPLSVWIAIGALVLAAALAVIIPAGRAASVNPDEALRAE